MRRIKHGVKWQSIYGSPVAMISLLALIQLVSYVLNMTFMVFGFHIPKIKETNFTIQT